MNSFPKKKIANNHEKEIEKIKSQLSKKINLNKLITDQKIEFTLDQSKNEIIEFIFQTSNTEKIFFTRNTETNKFDHKKLITNLK